MFWINKPLNDLEENIKQILRTTYSKTFPLTAPGLVGFDFQVKQFKISCYLVRPEFPAHNTSKFLSKRNIHTYLNWFPVEVAPYWKTPFYDLYKDFSVNEEAVPFVLIHIQTDGSQNSLNSYLQRLSLD